MGKRLVADWNFIEKLYRAGGLNNCEIVRANAEAHKHQNAFKPVVTEGAIRAYAKKKGWRRDLAHKVKKEALERLVRGEQVTLIQDEEIVSSAADAMASRVTSYRNTLARAEKVEERLFSELEADTAHEQPAIELEARVRIYKRLIAAMVARVKADRLCWNIDDADNNTAPQRIDIIQEF